MNPDKEVDVKSSEQSDAANLLRNLRDRAFDSSDEKLALALGGDSEWTGGVAGNIDDDVVMKARGIAQERGVEI